jgi:hypothetical protein
MSAFIKMGLQLVAADRYSGTVSAAAEVAAAAATDIVEQQRADDVHSSSSSRRSIAIANTWLYWFLIA